MTDQDKREITEAVSEAVAAAWAIAFLGMEANIHEQYAIPRMTRLLAATQSHALRNCPSRLPYWR